jgi:DNA-binding NarL/FixJ family response regulator
MTVKILLVEYQRLFRRGLCALLSKVRDFHIVAEKAEPELALKLVAETRPDVALVGLSLAGMSGFQLLEFLHDKFPELHVLVLTMHSSPHFVRRALSASAATQNRPCVATSKPAM